MIFIGIKKLSNNQRLSALIIENLLLKGYYPYRSKSLDCIDELLTPAASVTVVRASNNFLCFRSDPAFQNFFRFSSLLTVSD